VFHAAASIEEKPDSFSAQKKRSAKKEVVSKGKAAAEKEKVGPGGCKGYAKGG